MKWISAVLAAAALCCVEAAKRPIFMYANSGWTIWGDMCPDMVDMVNKGVTHIVLAFLVDKRPVDTLLQWEMNGSAVGNACLEELHAMGAKVFVSTGGATEHAFDKIPAQEYATAAAKFTIDHGFDGLDFDIEGLPPKFGDNPKIYNWLRDVSLVARDYFTRHGGNTYRYILHAPQGPYVASWGGDVKNGFGALAKELGDVVDYYLIQYYNQGDCRYDTYDLLFLNANCWDGGAAWNQISNVVGGNKHLQDKFVVGKITSTADGSVGYLEPNTLQSYLCRAERELGYTGGIMLWQFRGRNDSHHIAMTSALSGQMCGEGGNKPDPTAPPPPPPPVVTSTNAVSSPTFTRTDGSGSPIKNKKRPIWMYINVYFQNQAQPCYDLLEMARNGVTHIVISFLRNGQADDGLKHWINFNGRPACLSEVRSLGAKVIMSAGGEGETDFYSGSAVEYGARAAQAALDWDFDGLDFDLEHLGDGFSTNSRYQWLVDVSLEARNIFDAAGRPDMLIAHAPQSPYFAESYAGAGAGYIKLAIEMGDVIDYYLVQFYNQGMCAYQTYDAIFGKVDEPGCWCRGCTYGYFIDLLPTQALKDKIVVGKPANSIDAGGGFVESNQLAEIMCKAESELNYTAGLMTWSYRAGMMSNFFNALVGKDMCNDGVSSPPGGSYPSPSTNPVAPPPPSATKPPVQAPFDGECFTSTDNQWWHMDCNDSVVCSKSSVNDYGECLSKGATAPFYWAPNEKDCRQMLFDGGRCHRAPPSGDDAWEAPQPGRFECYISDTWWASCDDAKVCKFDGRFQTESSCLASGYPYSIWADTKDECKSAVKGKVC